MQRNGQHTLESIWDSFLEPVDDFALLIVLDAAVVEVVATDLVSEEHDSCVVLQDVVDSEVGREAAVVADLLAEDELIKGTAARDSQQHQSSQQRPHVKHSAYRVL